VDTEVAWLARWRTTRDGSPRLLSYGRDEREKWGGGGFARRACIGGNYEPERCVVGARSRVREAQKEGSNGDGELQARPALSMRVTNNQRGRESGVMREGSVRENGMTREGSVREGSKHKAKSVRTNEHTKESITIYILDGDR